MQEGDAAASERMQDSWTWSVPSRRPGRTLDARRWVGGSDCAWTPSLSWPGLSESRTRWRLHAGESGPLSMSHRPSGGSLPGTGSATVAEAERGGLPRQQHSSYVVLRSIDKVLSSIDVVL